MIWWKLGLNAHNMGLDASFWLWIGLILVIYVMIRAASRAR